MPVPVRGRNRQRTMLGGATVVRGSWMASRQRELQYAVSRGALKVFRRGSAAVGFDIPVCSGWRCDSRGIGALDGEHPRVPRSPIPADLPGDDLYGITLPGDHGAAPGLHVELSVEDIVGFI